MRKTYVGYMVCMLIMCMLLTACTYEDAAHAKRKEKGNIEKADTNKADTELDTVEEIEKIEEPEPVDEDVTTVNLNELMVNVDLDTGYEKLEDINSDKIEEVAIDFITDTSISDKNVTSISHGLMTITKDDDDIYRMRRFDESGHILWVKPLDVTSYIQRLDMGTMKDNGYIIAIVSSPLGRPDFLLSYDKNGQLLWKKDIYDYGFEELNDMVVTESQDILLMGTTNVKAASRDIKIVSVNKDGHIVREATFGGSDFESLYEVRYHPQLGIVLLGHTQSHDGDFPIKGDDTSQHFLACINEKLQLQWVRMTPNGYDGVLLSGTTIYVMESAISFQTRKTSILALDSEGAKIQEYKSITEGLWAPGMTLLANGYLIVGHRQRLGYEQGYGLCHLKIFNEELELMATIEDISISPKEIIATDDGGFILKMVRPIKTIPQPAYISMIWYDHETVLEKYDASYKLEWRKTYDLYPDSLQIEWIKPLSNGKVLMESDKMKAFKELKKSINPSFYKSYSDDRLDYHLEICDEHSDEVEKKE